QLGAYADDPNVLVLALPRGGVPVGYEVARKLRAPLDVFTVRKLGVPGHEEYAMGAIASGGVRVLNDYAIEQLNISQEEIEAVIADEMEELERRERLYRDGRPAPDIEGRTVLLVDDGMATGSSMAAAIKALRLHNPGKVVVAVPTASRRTSEEFEPFVDDIVCAITRSPSWRSACGTSALSRPPTTRCARCCARRSPLGAHPNGKPGMKINGHEVEVGNLDQVYFPDAGITKGDLIDYYRRIAPVMLPHLQGRPISMQRYPRGIEEYGFYQKEVSEHFPEWIDRADVYVKEDDATQPQVVVNNAATLVYLADQGVITLHTWLS